MLGRRAVDCARGRVVLVPVEHQHGSTEEMHGGERGPGAERGHHQLLAIGVGDDRRQDLAHRPADQRGRGLEIDVRDVGERSRDQVVVQEEDQRAAVVGKRRRRLEQVLLAHQPSGAEPAAGEPQ